MEPTSQWKERQSYVVDKHVGWEMVLPPSLENAVKMINQGTGTMSDWNVGTAKTSLKGDISPEF